MLYHHGNHPKILFSHTILGMISNRKPPFPVVCSKVPFYLTLHFTELQATQHCWKNLENLLRAPTMLQTTQSHSSKITVFFYDQIRSDPLWPCKQNYSAKKNMCFCLLYCHALIFMQLDASFWTRLAST